MTPQPPPSGPIGGSQPAPIDARREKAVKTARRMINGGQAAHVLPVLLPLEKRSRHDPELLHLLAIAYNAINATRRARACAERSFKLSAHPQKLLIAAQSYRSEGETDRAVVLCDQAIAEFPKAATQAMVTKAGALEESGQFDAARAIVGPLLADGELPASIQTAAKFEWAKLLVQGKEYDDANDLIDEMIALPKLTGEVRRSFLQLKAKSSDRKKDFAAAYSAAADANEIGKLEFDPDFYAEQVAVLVENWSAEALLHFPLADCQSEVPIFIAGMPRTGTSLIDQIINAHPLAAGVGELTDIESFAVEMAKAYDSTQPPPACFGAFDGKAFTRAAAHYVQHCKKLSPRGTERVVNKALGNNKLVGLLARLFPRTRVIHAIRDPRDVAISCFMGGFNNRLHAWSTQIDWAGHAWAQSERMMQHWKDVLDIPILDVHYEALVADPETQFRRIIEFIGLPWDDACLSFHKSRRTVRTLSYDQVNRPIYKTSSGRHINYAAFIDGVEFPAYEVPD